MLLATCGALNLLSVIDLLWTFGVIADPYPPSAAATGRQVWIWVAVTASVETNALLGRRAFRTFNEDVELVGDPRYVLSYLLASPVAYGLTLVIARSLAA